MSRQVNFHLKKFISLDNHGEDTENMDYGFAAFGEEGDAFDYLSEEEIKSMTPQKAYRLLPEKLQDEADDNEGFIYQGDFVSLPFGADKEKKPKERREAKLFVTLSMPSDLTDHEDMENKFYDMLSPLYKEDADFQLYDSSADGEEIKIDAHIYYPFITIKGFTYLLNEIETIRQAEERLLKLGLNVVVHEQEMQTV